MKLSPLGIAERTGVAFDLVDAVGHAVGHAAGLKAQDVDGDEGALGTDLGSLAGQQVAESRDGAVGLGDDVVRGLEFVRTGGLFCPEGKIWAFSLTRV